YKQINFLGDFKGFRLCDVRGLTKEQRASENFLQDLKMLIEGRIKPQYTFDTAKPIADDDPYYNKTPTVSDMMHCVIILFDITEAYEVHSSHQADIKNIMKELNKTNVPVSVILTKADMLDPSVRRNIDNIYHSRKVLRAVETAERSLRVPKKDIHPVVNFENEIRFEWRTSLPLLAALKSCVSRARSHFYNDSRLQRD
ncbi:interferon-induced protein 44-like, partial [Mercenaria mercenaria]|uniref:interferon-induced protein 44-like n=1 Tax=Mercenaria mercenaria TaxID=6596 RepID=UPI00234EB55E